MVHHTVKILTCFYDNLDVSDPTDPEVIIKLMSLTRLILLIEA